MSSNYAIMNLGGLRPSFVNGPQIKLGTQFDLISIAISKLWKNTTCPHTKNIYMTNHDAKDTTAKKAQDRFEIIYSDQEKATLHQNAQLINKTLNYVNGPSKEICTSSNHCINTIADEIYSLQSPVMKNPLVKTWVQAKLSEKMSGVSCINKAATAFAYMNLLNTEHQKISLYIRENDQKAYLVIGEKGTSLIYMPSTGEIYHHRNPLFLTEILSSNLKLVVTNCFTPQEFAVKLFQDGLMSDPAMTPFKRLLNNFHKAGSLQEKKEIALKLCEDVSQLYFRRNEQELSRFQALSTLYFQMKLLLEPDVYLNTVHSVIDAYFDPLSNK